MPSANREIKAEKNFRKASGFFAFLNFSKNFLLLRNIDNRALYFRSSYLRGSIKKVFIKNFSKFTGKHLCQNLFFKKVTDLSSNFVKIKTPTQMFSF